MNIKGNLRKESTEWQYETKYLVPDSVFLSTLSYQNQNKQSKQEFHIPSILTSHVNTAIKDNLPTHISPLSFHHHPSSYTPERPVFQSKLQESSHNNLSTPSPVVLGKEFRYGLKHTKIFHIILSTTSHKSKVLAIGKRFSNLDFQWEDGKEIFLCPFPYKASH